MKIRGMFAWAGALALTLGILAASTARPASAKSMPTGPDGVVVTFASQARDHATITAYLRRPALPANAKVPAIVALHGCGGLAAPLTRYVDWADRLVAAGYAVLFPDSFGSRGWVAQCKANGPKDQHVTADQRSLDALSAVEWLANQPFIAPQKIGVLGWSHGGMTTLTLVDRPKAEGAVAAAVAFYPDCRDAARETSWRHRVPLMIQIGESDDWSPVAACRELAKADPGFEMITYPDTWHDFDVPNEKVHTLHGVGASVNGDGNVHVGTNPVARAAAIKGTMEYFASHFGAEKAAGK